MMDGLSISPSFPSMNLRLKSKERRYVDGALLHTLRVPFGILGSQG